MYKLSPAPRIICKFPFLSQDLSSDILLIVYKNKDVFNISEFLKFPPLAQCGIMSCLPYNQGCHVGFLLTARNYHVASFFTGRDATRGRFLQPRVPRWVHSTQVVVAVGGGHQGTDAALSAVKRGQV